MCALRHPRERTVGQRDVTLNSAGLKRFMADVKKAMRRHFYVFELDSMAR